MATENAIGQDVDAVQSQSAVFRKELGLRDLVLTQILFVIGLSWVGAAAKLGPSHVIFWLVAMVLFYVPSAIVVTYLNRQMPLEGGLYQWAKIGCNGFIGFMVAWNLWLYVITNTSEVGLQLTTNLAYAVGPRADWMASDKMLITVVSCAVIGLLMVVSTIGLGLGKWVHNFGGVIMIVIFAVMLLLPIIAFMRGDIPRYAPLATAAPVISLFSLNILGKLGFGALGGFEYVAILAGESRNPARTISRSVVIAAPIIAVMFIMGTSSVLAFIPTSDIDLIAPIPQVLRYGLRSLGLVGAVVPIAIAMLICLRITQASVNFTGVTRLPMVAGWDDLMPRWFTKLHPRFRTPMNSIIVVGLVTIVMGLISLVGVGHQEAFQLLFNAGGIFYALTYLVMFSIPLLGLKNAPSRPPLRVRIAACSGLLMTLLYVTLSIFPIIQVTSWLSFSLKVSGVIIAANAIGISIFLAAKRRREKMGRSGFEPLKA